MRKQRFAYSHDAIDYDFIRKSNVVLEKIHVKDEDKKQFLSKRKDVHNFLL